MFHSFDQYYLTFITRDSLTFDDSVYSMFLRYHSNLVACRIQLICRYYSVFCVPVKNA